MTPENKDAFNKIIEACEVLGWNVMFDQESDDVQYMIIGKPEVLDSIAESME